MPPGTVQVKRAEMGQNFWIAFAAGLTAAAVTTAGIFAIRRFEAWARQNITYFACFAAGVLIAVSFLKIIPTSFAMNPKAPALLFAGYLFMLVFNRFLTAYVCDKPETAEYALGLIPLIGIGIHSFLDGVVYSISFRVSMLTGALVAFGMVLHEFPEGIVTYTLLVRSGFTGRQSFLLAFLAAGLTTPLGTLVSYPFVSRIAPPLLGLLLAFSAGALVYVGATHLLPRAESEPRRFSLVALAGGILVALGIIMTKG
ncbi:MAG: ZIP family metal transporter [Pseudolabrys sp.]